MSGFPSAKHRLVLPLTVLVLLLCAPRAFAQEELLNDRWYQIETEHFTILSQASTRQTTRFATEIESWRRLAARIIADVEAFPKANIPNFVFLFDDEESFNHFRRGQEEAFFFQTPRANYMALTNGSENSLLEAKHYYGHFLIRNFSDLRLPRWYEEGLSGYLGRIDIGRGEPEFNEFNRQNNIRMAELSTELSMERLLYRDDALASPRVVQIANLKSIALYHYLKHAYEQGFPDHRADLETYLRHVLDGRTERFSFDMGFPVTTDELDDELLDFLIGSSPETGEVVAEFEIELPEYSAVEISEEQIATYLGELGLNSGLPQHSEVYFRHLIDSGLETARSYSGLGDALRFKAQQEEVTADDQQIAEYFNRAVSMAPDDLFILMDYGEYWEAELHDCDKDYPANQRLLIIEDIASHFERAIALDAANAEANLAMGQVYLFEGQDWQNGIEYQRRAFSLLPSDSFIMEQSIKYSIAAADYDEAERLINEMAQPIHFVGEPGYVTALRDRLASAQRNEEYDECAEDS